MSAMRRQSPPATPPLPTTPAEVACGGRTRFNAWLSPQWATPTFTIRIAMALLGAGARGRRVRVVILSQPDLTPWPDVWPAATPALPLVRATWESTSNHYTANRKVWGNHDAYSPGGTCAARRDRATLAHCAAVPPGVQVPPGSSPAGAVEVSLVAAIFWSDKVRRSILLERQGRPGWFSAWVERPLIEIVVRLAGYGLRPCRSPPRGGVAYRLGASEEPKAERQRAEGGRRRQIRNPKSEPKILSRPPPSGRLPHILRRSLDRQVGVRGRLDANYRSGNQPQCLAVGTNTFPRAL